MRSVLVSLLIVVLIACGSAPDAAPPKPVARAQPTPLNLNTTSEADLIKVPGAGKDIAHEFVEYRPYVSIRQFRKQMERSVDEATITGFETYVYVPVDPERSDAATVAQLPGIDEAGARVLIKGRPYGSRQAFLDALGAQVSGTDLADATAMLTVE